MSEVKKVVTVANTVHTDLHPGIPDPKPGGVIIGELDGSGKETGKYFQVNERTYLRSFTDTTRFIVKKKHNQ